MRRAGRAEERAGQRRREAAGEHVDLEGEAGRVPHPERHPAADADQRALHQRDEAEAGVEERGSGGGERVDGGRGQDAEPERAEPEGEEEEGEEEERGGEEAGRGRGAGGGFLGRRH